MIPVKICGITSRGNAQMAVNYGASAIGMIFYEESPRYVHPHKVEEWISEISDQVEKVGVFVNETADVIKSITDKLNLNYIQLHGDETPQFCDSMIKPVIKVFRVDNNVDNSLLEDYNVHAFLFDTYKKGKLGGTGHNFNWDLLLNLKKDTPIILSGGLNYENIITGIDAVQPSAVDINSSVESVPGVKDERKVRQLFDVLKNTKSNLNIFKNSYVEEK